MRALLCEQLGEPRNLRLTDVPEPVPGPGDVLIQVAAVGLGYVDSVMVRGAHQTTATRKMPFIPGYELSGRIVAVGAGVAPGRIGERVMAIGPSALAERAVLPADICVAVPDTLSDEMAAGAIASYCTNVYALETLGRLAPGEVLMVLGASGGVGASAVDLGKGMGATVVACASSPEKLAAAARRGADILIDYSVANWRDALKAALKDRTVDVVYDPVGGGLSETAFRCLGPRGRHLVIGFASGEIPRIPLNLPLVKRASIIGVDLGGEMRERPTNILAYHRRFLELYESGKVHPEQPSVHPLDAAGGILQDLLDRKVIGKAVIAVGG